MHILQRIAALFAAIAAFFAALFGGQSAIKPVYPSVPTEYAYGIHERQKVDFVLPENVDGELGLILNIHGGAWIMGDKKDYGETLKAQAASGYAAAALNYRYLAADVPMTALLDDITAALTRVKAVAEMNGVTLTRVLLTGVSAGAHLSLLYAYSRAQEAPIVPAAVVSYCGPTDLADPVFIEQNALGDANWMLTLANWAAGVSITVEEYYGRSGNYGRWLEALRAVSPEYCVTPQSAPTVIAHGVVDEIVPYAGAVRLNAALTEAGVAHEFITFPHSGHGLDRDPDCLQRVNELFIEYAQRYLR